MAGLVGYGSSGNEEDEESRSLDTCGAALEAPTNKENSVLIGPQALSVNGLLDDDGYTSSLSPYSANRAAIHNLTLPIIANLDIPPSPPASPPPRATQISEHFMQLKKQGVHFNEKLAGSSALKNPTLLQKLMSSVGLMESDQYTIPLPKGLWDPSAFPGWAYKEELVKTQQQITRKKEEESARTQRDSIDFIPAVNERTPNSAWTTASMLGSKGNRASAADRVAAGLDQGRAGSSQRLDGSLRRDLERRSGRRGDR
ncbi:MAG: hypothetical protein Q9166_008018 [cf. Caloplaca sp. 2 TL-2023]